MKTIRIKRPDAIGKPAEGQAEAPAPAEESGATLTQRKTLKLSRPGAVRPAGKFGVKKPGAPAPAEAAAEGEVSDVPDVADIPEMPGAQARPSFVSEPSADVVADVPTGVNVLSVVVQIAACAAIGFLGYCLYQDMQLPLFCGGCGWGQ